MDPIDLVDKIRSDSPSIQIGGTTYYIVELDRKVAETQLQAYAEEVLSASDPNKPPPTKLDRLVAATVDGKPMRWKIPVRLKWTIDEASFGGRDADLNIAREICAQATADWNDAAKRVEIDDKVRFEEDAAAPVFRFAFRDFNDPNLFAVAFFPNDPPKERVVNIGPATFPANCPFDRVGVIRHELGHVLGFRHEHIRPEAQVGMDWWEVSQMEKWVTGGIGGEALNKYDSQSVMHYPLNGAGTLKFKLSEADISGFGKLYQMPSDEVKHFPV